MNRLINAIMLQVNTETYNSKFEVVVGVIAIIFVGIVAYLISLDRKMKKLEDK